MQWGLMEHLPELDHMCHSFPLKRPFSLCAPMALQEGGEAVMPCNRIFLPI